MKLAEITFAVLLEVVPVNHDGRSSLPLPAFFLFSGDYRIQPQMSLHCIRPLLKLSAPVLRFTVSMDLAASPFLGALNEQTYPGLLLPRFNWHTAVRGPTAERPAVSARDGG